MTYTYSGLQTHAQPHLLGLCLLHYVLHGSVVDVGLSSKSLKHLV
jgi:hypothetical protein